MRGRQSSSRRAPAAAPIVGGRPMTRGHRNCAQVFVLAAAAAAAILAPTRAFPSTEGAAGDAADSPEIAKSGKKPRVLATSTFEKNAEGWSVLKHIDDAVPERVDYA